MCVRKIAFLHMVYPMGGAEMVTRHVAGYLCDNGFDVWVLATRINHDKMFDSSPKIRYEQMPIDDFMTKDAVDCIAQTANRLGIDLLVVGGILIPHLTRLKQHLNGKLMYMLHGTPFWEAEYKKFNGKRLAQTSAAKWFEWHFLRKPSYVLFNRHIKKIGKIYREIYDTVDVFGTLTDSYGRQIAESLGVSVQDNKFRTFTNPCANDALPVEQKRKQVLYVGRLTYADKRIDRLVRVWSMVESKMPDWEFLIVGEGEYESALREQVRSLGLKRVRFCGYTSDVRPYYRDGSILMLSSTIEGWGMVLCEAQSSEVACIAFDSSAGIREILAPSGENGVLVPPFDLREYARQLERLMADDELRSRIARGGKQSVQRFSVESVGAHWVKFLESI